MAAEQERRVAPSETRVRHADLAAVAHIEQAAYRYPWSAVNLRDSLDAGHDFLGLQLHQEWLGYSILMAVVDEVHLLNLTIAPRWQRQGLGRQLLRYSLRVAADQPAMRSVLLEVRPSNQAALALYESEGFVHIGRRRGYYPAPLGREDALVLRRRLP